MELTYYQEEQILEKNVIAHIIRSENKKTQSTIWHIIRET